MQNNIYWKLVSTAFGECLIVATDEGICWIGTPGRTLDEAMLYLKRYISFDEMRNEDSEVLRVFEQQLQEYAQGKRKHFDGTFTVQGTNFQKQVWQALCEIPYGVTTTYKVIAQKIGNPKAVRAVGTAIGANPLSILIPCHRVIGTNNTLTGYAGGLEMKKKLLKLENISL